MNFKKFLEPKALLIIGVAVVGGLFLASKFRPKSGGSSEEEQTVIARPVEMPYGVDVNPDEQRYDSAPTPAPQPAPQPAPKPVPVPYKPPLKPGPGGQLPPGRPGAPPMRPAPPREPKPQPQPQPLPGTPRRDTPPVPIPGPAPTTPNVPGGYNLDCRGVLPRPPDHPGTDVIGDIKRSRNPSQRRGKWFSWAVGGITSRLTPSKMQEMKKAINNEVLWPAINQQRRSRGLKAMTKPTFQQLRDYINSVAGYRDDFSDATLMHLWNTYHLPYLCS